MFATNHIFSVIPFAPVRTSTSGWLLFTLLLAGGLSGVGTTFAQSAREWGTYFGGIGDESQASIATDVFGNVYLAGTTSSTALPGFLINNSGGNDAFLVKFNPTGGQIWGTFFGWNFNEEAFCVSTDAAGNVYLAGQTDSPSGIASGGSQTSFGGGQDAFLVKFDVSGIVKWATYYGGAGDEVGQSVATDNFGNVYLAGHTNDSTNIANCIASGGGAQNTSGGGLDAFLVKFNSSGARQWGTYYGGTKYEEAKSVAADDNGNVYITGFTGSDDFPVYNPFNGAYFKPAPLVGSDAFLVKFDSFGTIKWATCYGGASYEIGFSVATDAANNVYLAGYTGSNAGIASGGFQNTHGTGTDDAFLVKFSSSGARLWGTYYGGTSSDGGYSLATDAASNVYLGGWTSSSSGLATIDGFQNVSGGGNDHFLVKFDPGGGQICATYYGGAGYEMANNSIATDNAGKIYMAGWTSSSSGLASSTGASQYTFGGGTYDTYLAKFSAPLSVNANSTNILCFGQCTGTAMAFASGGKPPYTYSWSTTPVQNTQTATGLCAGIYTVTVLHDTSGYATATVNITQPSSPLTATLSSNSTAVCSCSGAVSASPSGGASPYFFGWNTGATTSAISGLCGGTYGVVVTDKNSCTVIRGVSIQQPTVAITYVSPNPTICSGNSITIGVQASGGLIQSYLWSTGAITSTIPVNPTSTTTYSVIVSRPLSPCTATAFVTVTVIQTPTVTINNTGGGNSICLGKSATLTASGGGGSVAYEYSWNTGHSTAAIEVAPSINTVYTVSVSNTGMCTRTKTFTVNVTYLNTALTAASDTLCRGETTTLNVSPPSAGTYAWNTIPPQSTTVTTNPTINITPLNTTTYIVTFTNPVGCKGADTIVITVNPTPTISIGGKTTICSGVKDTLTAGGGTSYLWSNGDPTSSSIITHANAGPNTYTVAHSVTVSIGPCSRDTSIIITVKPHPVIIANAVTICAGQIATLTASGGFKYWWFANGITTIPIDTGATTTVSPASASTYTVVGINPIHYCPNKAVATVTIDSLVINAGNAQTICPGYSTELSATVLGGSSPYTYLWSPGNLLNDSTSAKPSATPGSTTIFYLRGWDNKGCSALDSVIVYVLNSENCRSGICDNIYNGITPNGDQNNDTWWINGIEAFPDSNTVSIFNRWGNRVWVQKNYTNDEGWAGTAGTGSKGGNLPDGTYFYVIEMYHNNKPVICKGWIEVTH